MDKERRNSKLKSLKRLLLDRETSLKLKDYDFPGKKTSLYTFCNQLCGWDKKTLEPNWFPWERGEGHIVMGFETFEYEDTYTSAELFDLLPDLIAERRYDDEKRKEERIEGKKFVEYEVSTGWRVGYKINDTAEEKYTSSSKDIKVAMAETLIKMLDRGYDFETECGD